MKVPRPRFLLLGVVLAAGATLLLGGTHGFGRGSDDVPAARVARGALSRTVRAEGVLKARKATPLLAPVADDDVSYKIGWILDDGMPVKTGDVVVRFDPTETENTLLGSRADAAAVDTRVRRERAESGAALSNLSRDAEMARRERTTAETFQSRDPELYSRIEIIEADIDVDLAGSRERHAREVRSVREEVSRFQLDLLGIDRKKAGLKIGKAVKQLGSLEVRAPHDGIVVLKRDWKGDTPQVGQSVWGGFPLAEIPDLSLVDAEVWVLEADAGGLATGRKGTVRVESRPLEAIAATVTQVDALAKPRLRGVPVQYFGATLALSRTDPATMKPGQRIVALLDLSDGEPALTVPLPAVHDRDGKKVVFRRDGSSWRAVEVEVGASALGRVAVTKGLAEGDLVALVDPRKPRGAAPPSPGPGAALPGGSGS